MTLSNKDHQLRALQATAQRIHAMNDDHFCWGCESWLQVEELQSKHDYLDGNDSRSRIDYYVCPNCGRDEIEPISEKMVLEFLADLAKPQSQKRNYREVRHDIIKEWIECM